MRLKKTNQPKQGSGRQARLIPRADRPTFSYYANRPPDATVNRSTDRQTGRVAEPQKSRAVPLPRISLMQISYWLLMVVVAVCAGKLLFLSTSPKLIVLGQSAVTSTYLQSPAIYTEAAHKLLAGSITSHTKITADVNGTTEALERHFPELETVSVTLPLIGNRPIVYVQVAQPSVVLQTGNGNYALSASGLVLAKLKALPGGVPTLTDQSASIPTVGKQYLPGSTVAFIRTAAFQLAAAKIPVSTYVLPASTAYELDMRPEGKQYIVKYNLQGSALEQSGAAIATLRQIGEKPTGYLDVRVPGRVYYK